MIDKVQIDRLFKKINEYWTPKIAGEINDMQVKLVKLKGEFVWHHHDHEDESFLVHKGDLLMRFKDSDVRVGPGEFIIVPRGVEHLPVAESDECEVVLLEPKTTLNTGNIENERTVRDPDRIG